MRQRKKENEERREERREKSTDLQAQMYFRKERKKRGDTRDTSKQVHQVTMATRECGLKFIRLHCSSRDSKWHPSGLTESMHLPECSGLLLESALGIERNKFIVTCQFQPPQSLSSEDTCFFNLETQHSHFWSQSGPSLAEYYHFHIHLWMNLGKLQETVRDREARCAAVPGAAVSDMA